mmetsp:Transcript_12601/g.22016  ORF Transcript_12601/g.22016 Transcript_12601/m.22016 type:complete len:200 (+) Transcript_12601:785-1384(+)
MLVQNVAFSISDKVVHCPDLRVGFVQQHVYRDGFVRKVIIVRIDRLGGLHRVIRAGVVAQARGHRIAELDKLCLGIGQSSDVLNEVAGHASTEGIPTQRGTVVRGQVDGLNQVRRGVDLTRLLVARGGDAAGSFLPGNADLVLDVVCLFHRLRLQRLPLNIVCYDNIFGFFAFSELGFHARHMGNQAHQKLVAVVTVQT